MKFRILCILVLWAGSCFAQSQLPPTGSANGLNRIKGGLVIDSMLNVPIRDTAAWNGIKGDFVNKNDTLYYREGANYKRIGGLSGTIWINQVAGLQDSLSQHTVWINQKVNIADSGTVYVTPTEANVWINGSAVDSISITGDSVKTVALRKGNGSWLSSSFTDNDRQNISRNGNTLSIEFGNTVDLPTKVRQVFTGTATTFFPLTNVPINASNVKVILNTASQPPSQWSLSSNIVTTTFTTETTDVVVIEYTY